MNKLCEVCNEREAVRPKRAPIECERCFQRRYYRENKSRRRIPAVERMDPIGYAYAHQKVKRIRGRASDQTCARCFRDADEWSYTPGDQFEQSGVVTQRVDGREWSCRMTWSPNVYAYEPLCRECHYRKDGRVS